ncbi:MAG: DUF998 domain-containing protein [Fervidicoccus fontis]
MRKNPSKWIRYFKYQGIIAFLIAFIGILIAVKLNPWFDVSKNALSDLGRIGLKYSSIFNITLIISSLFAISYIPYMLKLLSNKFGAFSVGVYTVGAFHLFLIGMFPEGTKFHWFVSLEFFILMSISLFLFSITMLTLKRKTSFFLFLILFLLSLLGSLFVRWPSTALLEIYNITIYFFGFLILYFSEYLK